MLVNSYFIKEKGMGLGDFIRGSIASQQLCIEYGLPFQVDLSHHPIGKYIVQRCDAPTPTIDSILNLQDIPNFTIRALKSHLKSNINLKTLQHENLYIYTNVWPTFKIASIVSKRVRDFFIPNQCLESAIKTAYDAYGNYGIIHIRAGDLLAFNTQIGDTVHLSLNELMDMLHPHLKALSGKNYIVMSDCAELKTLVSNRYGFCCTSSKPSHLALNNDNTLDTLVDYFILTRSSHIHQFSVHGWGSGFSDSAHWLYRVPITKHKLSPTN
jgi:hypothetical protein